MGHRSIAILIACLLAAPLLAGLTIAGDASADTMTAWMSGTVHEEISAGEFVLQEMDDGGYLHVVYYDENEGAIGYATNAGGAWTHEVVPNTENAGDRASLALDSEGNAHISFFDSEGRLKYANNIGSWIVTTVINADVEWSAIVMDGEDQAHIVYVDEDEDAVMYVNKLTSGWSEPVEIDTSFDGFSGLVATIGDDDVIHIAYMDIFERELVYAYGHGDEWNDEVIE